MDQETKVYQPLKPEWTVMVYMAADTGDSFYQKAMEDITEMTAAEFDADRIKVVVYADAPAPWLPRWWEVEGSTKGNRGQAIERGVGKKTLLEFVQMSTKMRPATFYLLVLWGHGEGIDWNEKVLGTPGVKRFGQGSQSALEIGELGRILDKLFGKSSFDPNRVIVGFDACLMGMVEVYYQIHQYVGRVVAANDEIPDTGWPYKEILSKLNPRMEPAGLARTIVEECPRWYSEKSHESNVSFSACKLDGPICLRLGRAVSDLREVLEEQVGTELGLKAIREARDFAEDYRERAYVDLNAFCRELGRVVGRESKKAVQDFVRKHVPNGPPDEDLNPLCEELEKVPVQEVKGAFADVLRKFLGTHRADKSYEDGLSTCCEQLVRLINLKIRATGVIQALDDFVIAKNFSDEYPYKYHLDSRAVSICFPESEDLEGSIPGFQINWGNYMGLQFSRDTDWPKLMAKFWNEPRLE